MTKPPAKKTTQSEHIKTALRLPPDLHTEIQDAALRNGRSMNAEILTRLKSSRIDEVLAELTEVKAMVRKVLDHM